MRASTPELDTPYPLAGLLPAVLQEDDLTTRLTAGLDAVLAPVISTLDCLHAYVDPHLAPADFVAWLAGWVGVVLDDDWPLDRRRATVAEAVALYRSRGTVAGLRAHLEVMTGGRVEVADTGGVTWTTDLNAEPVVPVPPSLHVRVVGPDRGASDPVALRDFVCAAKPAHVPHTVEVVD